jgi:hypothetical protein
VNHQGAKDTKEEIRRQVAKDAKKEDEGMRFARSAKSIVRALNRCGAASGAKAASDRRLLLRVLGDLASKPLCLRALVVQPLGAQAASRLLRHPALAKRRGSGDGPIALAGRTPSGASVMA